MDIACINAGLFEKSPQDWIVKQQTVPYLEQL